MADLPYKTVKRILSEYVNGDVSKDGCLKVKEFCENILYWIAKESLRELDNINTLRRIHNVPELKRISSSIYLKILNSINNQLSDLLDGNVGNASANVTTTLSEADETWYYA